MQNQMELTFLADSALPKSCPKATRNLSKGRCASQEAAVIAQQPVKTLISRCTLPKQSSKRCCSQRKRRRRKKFLRGFWKYDSDDEEISSNSGGGSGGSSGEETYNDVPFSTNERLRCIGCNGRRPSFSDTELISDSVIMPIGTSNPTLKSSFSLTSLRSFAPTDSPEHGTPLRIKNERLYHSLTKKSRKSNEQDKELWRKSWGSGISQDGKEFWEGFQADYDYLMAQNILEKMVSDISIEKVPTTSTPTSPLVWTHSEFMDHFAQLYSWLKGIQDLVYGKQENVTDWKLRAERQEDMQRQRFRLDAFNDQSKKLISRYPELESEVSWLTKHVNDKWETVEGMMGVTRKGEGDRSRSELGCQEKVDHEIKCLRRWLRELDGKLKPLSFHQGWTKAELDMKTKEHMVLHRDIEAHRKIVSSLFKLCEKADASTLIAARALERKYHEYYLRSLEWQYHIESLVGLQVNKSPPSWSNDSDGEPVAKIARFSYGKDADDKRESDGGEPALTGEENGSFEEMSLNMDVASPALAERFDSMEDVDSDSISGSEEYSSTTRSTLEPNSRSFSAFSGVKREHETTAGVGGGGGEGASAKLKPKFVTGSPTKVPTVLPVSNGLNGKEVATSRVGDSSSAATAAAELNRPQRPPNTGTFSCKHLDTDSEQERSKMSEEGKGQGEVDGKDGETTSSEDGWTYASGGTQFRKGPEVGGLKRKANAAVRSLDFGCEGTMTKGSDGFSKEMRYFSAKNIPKTGSVNVVCTNKEPISSSNRKLVDLADALFRYKPKSSRSKQAKMKWTNEGEDEKPLDSCDASGEYTEDSDEMDSQSSEDNDSSIATCKRSESAEGILDESRGTKPLTEVCLRANKSAAMRNRPWSMSNVSLFMKNSRGSSLKSRSSMSETALNQMPSPLDKAREFGSCHKNGRTLSTEDGAWGSCGSSRKRRSKIRKRLSKKSNSGSDGVTLSGSDSPNLSSSPAKQIANISGIVKSGSFSGVSRKQRDFSPPFTKCESGSATETDEESCGMNLPRFRLGPKTGAVTVATGAEREKIIQVEEQLSLNSDQAYWDNYQEKYQSEAYSEDPADSDTAKNLLEFGEDYGKYLGNQSDCASRWHRSVKSRSRSKFDSDSDVDEVKRFLRQSMDQLDLVEMKLNEKKSGLICANSLAEEENASKTYLDEIITTCRQNVDCLTKLLNDVDDEMHIPKVQNCIHNVKESWEDLKSTAELHKAKQLKNDMTALKTELLNWAASIESMETTVTSREELEAKIIHIKDELNTMRKGKSKLIQANVSVHRFLSTAKHAEPALRDDVIELYHVWEQTFSRVSTQLSNLQSLLQAWHDFDDHLSLLQCALRTDTLKVIDFALQCGTSEVTGSLKDIAGLLSVKDAASNDAGGGDASTNANGVNGGEKQDALGAVSRPLLTAFNTEGSLSDSGISDSGSEQEMNEREKRLAQLKRLAKRLESILAPSSQALSNMFKRIEEAESGLRELQKTYRDLIVRSSSSEEIKMMVSKASNIGAFDEALVGSRTLTKTSSGKRIAKGKGQKTNDSYPNGIENFEDGKDEGKSSKKSWLWRLVRFALPLQLALVALLCVACMMEPRCCDSLNNLELSLNPQLRYDSGPPPV